jgi:enamine deaminase RidA (YjgF/YER057c/UK114 family)
MSFEQKLKDLGINLPEVAAPVAAYVPVVKVDKIVYTAGQVAFVDGELKYKGKLGGGVSIEDGYKAARICAMNALAAVKSISGSLDNIERIVRVTGFVNSKDDFTDQAKVINGASELMLEIFGDSGLHARSAVGVNALPLGACVEVELIVKLK